MTALPTIPCLVANTDDLDGGSTTDLASALVDAGYLTLPEPFVCPLCETAKSACDHDELITRFRSNLSKRIRVHKSGSAWAAKLDAQSPAVRERRLDRIRKSIAQAVVNAVRDQQRADARQQLTKNTTRLAKATADLEASTARRVAAEAAAEAIQDKRLEVLLQIEEQDAATEARLARIEHNLVKALEQIARQDRSNYSNAQVTVWQMRVQAEQLRELARQTTDPDLRRSYEAQSAEMLAWRGESS